MCLFRPNSKVDGAFLLYALNGPIGRKQAIQAAVGAAHPHINLGDIKAYRIPLPSLDEQKRIISQLDELSENVEGLKSRYERKLNSLLDLKASILDRAFCGELTSPPLQSIKVAAE
jgi:type I restriction enzyme, S subunit